MSYPNHVLTNYSCYWSGLKNWSKKKQDDRSRLNPILHLSRNHFWRRQWLALMVVRVTTAGIVFN